jgi:Ca2+-dependent lipid-binding protein
MSKAGDYVGTLRVHVLDAEGLSSRDDGSARQAYATVNVTDFSKRRTARTSVVEGASMVTWGETFDFEDTSMHALVVVDLWDAGTASVLLGKARLCLEGVRPGVPHTTFQPLLDGGTLVLRVDFDSGLNS